MEEDVRVVVLASGLEKFFTAGLDSESAPFARKFITDS